MAALRDSLLGHAQGGRPIPSSNLHLTLVFLGATALATRECYEAAAASVNAPAMSLTFDAARFWRRSGVIWCGCETVPPALTAMHRSLVDGLVDCGYRAETRPFAAHVTLARNVRRINQPLPQPRLQWDVGEFYLMKSTTYADGAQYEALRRWPLRRTP